MLSVGTNSYMLFFTNTWGVFTGRHKIKGHNFLSSFRLHDQGVSKLNRQLRFDISRQYAICKYLKLTCDQFVLKNIYFYQQLPRLINIFLASVSLLYHKKTQKYLLVSDVFRGYKVKHLLKMG